MGAQVAAVGCLVGLNHYSGQDIPAIGEQRQHKSSKCCNRVLMRWVFRVLSYTREFVDGSAEDAIRLILIYFGGRSRPRFCFREGKKKLAFSQYRAPSFVAADSFDLASSGCREDMGARSPAAAADITARALHLTALL